MFFKETCIILRLLVSMAPLSAEVLPITSNTPPHLGPPCPQAHTPWFKLFLYHLTGSGPPSLLLARGQCFFNFSFLFFKFIITEYFK